MPIIKNILLSAAAALIAAAPASSATRSKKSDINANINIFTSVVKELQSNYVDTIDMEATVRTGIDAMLYKLDPYTEYFPRQEQQEFRNINAGEYGGIGSYIMERDSAVYISGPQEGAPAALCGLRWGDKILMIDTVDVKGLGHSKVSEMLKGPRGTRVKVKVQRPFVQDSILTFDIKRDRITIPAVGYYTELPGGIGYIMLSQYSEKSDAEVRSALLDLVNNHRIKGLILDLRDNGGGYLESAVKILGYFLPKGTEVLRTRGRGILNEKVYKTTSKPIAPNLPLVVLTDGGTASASEITAGALQDLDRAVIIGSRSFGKGLVQSTFSLPYDGMVKITTAKYYIPSGRLIQAIDYSHRNADGSAQRIADSLTTEFRTANGRIVRDGGGITPHIAIELPEVSRLTYNVVTDNWIFDYANRFAATTPSIPSPDDFVVTDSIYDDFKSFIDPAKLDYDKVSKTMMEQMRKVATVEGYMTDSLEQQFKIIEQMMSHSLDKDLDTHRAAIQPYLERDIVERYYYQKGAIAKALHGDKTVEEAVAVLTDPKRYSELLKPATDKPSGK